MASNKGYLEQEENWNRWYSRDLKSYGFRHDTPDERDYLAGTLPKDILAPKGQWKPPEFERQNRGFETYACVSFGVNSIVEILYRTSIGQDINLSDRFLAKMSDTQVGGNTPRKVYRTLKDKGALGEADYPWVDSWKEYYKDIPKKLKRKAKRFTYHLQYEKINRVNLKEFLQYSPIGCSVTAWHQKDGVYYKPPGSIDNHFCIIIGYEDGHYWRIFDTYDSQIKNLEWNYDFDYLARYRLNKRPIVTWKDLLLDYFREIFI